MLHHVITTAFCAAIAASTPALARDLVPAGPIILTVSDAGGATWAFDRETLATLGWETITTVTPFTEGPQRFSGVPLSAVVAATGVTGTTMDAIALNDYRVQIPAGHIERHGVFLALDNNGTPMRVRDRGPIWVIYPSETLEAASRRFDSLMVWQLHELRFQ